MNIELKSVMELRGMSFVIPNYQRGYRWTEQQVKDLLNDVNEFVPSEKSKYYCLQPVVVKDRTSEKDILSKINEKKGDFTKVEEIKQCLRGEYEVIDGQQRLTTIFLILKYLTKDNSFTLNYETRKDSAKFLNEIEEKDDKDNTSASVNIDYYHIWQAYNYITNWFSGYDDEKKKAFMDKVLDNVQFIWYVSDEKENPVEVFKRLNIGKISLTNAELIKALFLNRSHFPSEGAHLRLRQQEIASEWDNIEYTLQDEEFWLFLHNKGYKNPTRIDSIFDLICKGDKLEINDKIRKNHNNSELDEIIGTDEYRTFRYFYEYFQLEEHNIEICWANVKQYYDIFLEWYHDLMLYHYIGYYLIECNKQGIDALVTQWETSSNKKEFIAFLKGAIKMKIDHCPHDENKSVLDYQYKEDGSDKRQCLPILLFHNIQTVINQNTKQQENENYQLGAFYKFPFHLYKIENWDVEHINSNTTNTEEDDKTREEWLCNVYLGVNDDTRKEIDDYFKKTDEDDKNKAFEAIKNSIADDYEKWSTTDNKNKIFNYTLLDRSTNRSYGNSIFSAKRRIIIGKDKGVLVPIPKIKDGKLEPGQEQKAISSFVPPCTKQVFMKYYSSAIGNSNYWLPTDAKAYLDDIKECIKQLEKPKEKKK